MGVRQRRRITDASQNMQSAAAALLTCGTFGQTTFSLPSERGAQLSMTGEIVAYGNRSAWDDEALERMLRAAPGTGRTAGEELANWIARKRYLFLCGECDRCVAMTGVMTELFRSGVTKLIVAADTPSERDNLARSLELMRSSLGNVEVTTYRPEHDVEFRRYQAPAAVYGFLTSEAPQILVIGRDSFSRSSNILHRGGFLTGDPARTEAPSLASLLRAAHPAVLTSSTTVAGGRTLAKNAEVFDPAMTLVFTGEVRRLRDAVLYRPAVSAKHVGSERAAAPEQIGF